MDSQTTRIKTIQPLVNDGSIAAFREAIPKLLACIEADDFDFRPHDEVVPKPDIKIQRGPCPLPRLIEQFRT